MIPSGKQVKHGTVIFAKHFVVFVSAVVRVTFKPKGVDDVVDIPTGGRAVTVVSISSSGMAIYEKYGNKKKEKEKRNRGCARHGRRKEISRIASRFRNFDVNYTSILEAHIMNLSA